jgi:hypothetical protein
MIPNSGKFIFWVPIAMVCHTQIDMPPKCKNYNQSTYLGDESYEYMYHPLVPPTHLGLLLVNTWGRK